MFNVLLHLGKVKLTKVTVLNLYLKSLFPSHCSHSPTSTVDHRSIHSLELFLASVHPGQSWHLSFKLILMSPVSAITGYNALSPANLKLLAAKTQASYAYYTLQHITRKNCVIGLIPHTSWGHHIKYFDLEVPTSSRRARNKCGEVNDTTLSQQYFIT